MTDPWELVCCECGERIDERRPNTFWQEVVGWEKKRLQGGTNHVALRRPTGRVTCIHCMAKLLDDLNPGQMALG